MDRPGESGAGPAAAPPGLASGSSASWHSSRGGDREQSSEQPPRGQVLLMQRLQVLGLAGSRMLPKEILRMHTMDVGKLLTAASGVARPPPVNSSKADGGRSSASQRAGASGSRGDS